MRNATVLTISLAALLAACNTATPSAPLPGGAPTGGESGQAYAMAGTVRDAQGNPLAGVEVFADNTLYYDMNALGITDASGSYRISLPRDELGTWRGGAYLEREYHGTTYKYSLHPNDSAPFATGTGAVRNFEWRLSGKDPEGGDYGAPVWVYQDYSGGGFDTDGVELTLVPDGPIIDGSAGRTIVATTEGGQIRDVPVGRYTISARYTRADGSKAPLLLRERGTGSFEVSVTADFRQSFGYGTIMELEGRVPSAE